MIWIFFRTKKVDQIKNVVRIRVLTERVGGGVLLYAGVKRNLLS